MPVTPHGRAALLGLFIGTAFAGACVEIPGKAAVLATVELPDGETALGAQTEVHFSVVGTDGQGTLVADRKYAWTSPYTYTIRGVPVHAAGVFRVEARLTDGAGTELGSARKDTILKPGTQSELVALQLEWTSQTDGGGAEEAGAPPSSPPTGAPPPARVCNDGETTACGACGTMSCVGGKWDYVCKGDGRPVPCGICGRKICNSWGSFTNCEGTGLTQKCGQCGAQICTTGGVWSACEPQALSQACAGGGYQHCGANGNWDFTCKP